jgi:signal transduction histidine kinase
VSSIPLFADTANWPEPDFSRAASLAMMGLATKLSTPALLHALKGHLHNLALLTELLQQETASARDIEALRASADKRATTLRHEIDAMHRYLRLLESLAGWQDLHHEAFCEVHSGLAEVLQAVRVEAARRQVQVRLDVMPEPTLIVCPPSAFQQVILTCTIYTIQRSRRGEVVVIASEEANGVTFFDFLGGELADAEVDDDIAHALDLDLLATLANMAGARFIAEPTMRVAFRTASH